MPKTHTILLLLTVSMLYHPAFAQQDADSPTLGQQLEEAAAASAQRLPPELQQTMQDATEALRASGITQRAKQRGDKAVDAVLTGWDGATVRLSDLWMDGPIVLMWYRGGWCPYCNIQLRAMQKGLDAIEDAGARLVVLTPELPEKAKETAEANELSMVALYDKHNETARAYGVAFRLPESLAPLYRDRLKLAEYNGDDSLELPLAATYVIDQDGMIRYAFLDADYRKRAEPADVTAAVRALSQVGDDNHAYQQ